MNDLTDHPGRIAAALRGALGAEHGQTGAGAASEMLGVAESLAAIGSLDVDDLRSRGLTDLPLGGPAALLVRALPFGLATPGDRPRLRRDAYRCAAAAKADEGTALGCVAASLVVADLLRWDPAMTAIRVRQSLLEDAPMALLDRFTLLPPAFEDGGERRVSVEDPGAVLQIALSALTWPQDLTVSGVLAALGEEGRGPAGTLAAALAGAAIGRCDVPVDDDQGRRADQVAGVLGGAIAAGAAG